jgi:hypothetical protein
MNAEQLYMQKLARALIEALRNQSREALIQGTPQSVIIDGQFDLAAALAEALRQAKPARI